MTPLDELLHVTVRIQTHGQQEGVGTGFLFAFNKVGANGYLCIVTNKHVIDGATCGEVVFTRRTADGKPDIGQERTVWIDNFDLVVPHPDDEVDLVAIPLVPILRAAGVALDSIYHPALDRSIIKSEAELARLFPIEDIIMVGYPEGLWDSFNNVPLIRRGITATSINLDYDGTKQFLIDCAVFTGSSGSPVFLFNPTNYLERQESGGLQTMMQGRISLVGILWGHANTVGDGDEGPLPVPTSRTDAERSGLALNLGFCEKATSLDAFEEHFARVRHATDNPPPLHYSVNPLAQ